MPAHPPTDDDLPERPEEQPVPDEVWARFLSDSEGRIRATAPKEPSARARQVARRLREQDALALRETRRPAFRRSRSSTNAPGNGHPANPPGWRTSPPRRLTPRHRLRAVARFVIPAVIGIGVLLVVMNPSAATAWLGHGRPSAPRRSAAPAVGAPSATPPAAGTPTAAHPFAGSPALHWADGAAGIVTPAAHPVGGLTGAQVAAALADAKRYVVATELDPATLRGGFPTAAARLMAPDSGWSAAVREDFAHPTTAHNPLSYVTRYRTGQLRPAGTVIKVRGTMTYGAGARGAVEIRTDYSFVHPFLKARANAGHARADQAPVSRSIVRQSLDLRVYPPSLTPGAAGRLWLQDTSTFDFNTSCGREDGYLHPGFGADGDGNGPAANGPGTTRSADPYDLTVPPASLPKDCATTSRT